MLKLHLGCGSDIRDGYINIDFTEIRPAFSRKGTEFFTHDLSKGLPKVSFMKEIIKDVDVIFSSHFWEHLSYEEGMNLLRECCGVLKPGGIFRMGLPKVREACEAYLKNDYNYFAEIETMLQPPTYPKETRSLIDYVDFSFRQNGEHKICIDQEKACKMMQAAGFENVKTDEYDPEIDNPNPVRIKYTFYTEGCKAVEADHK